MARNAGIDALRSRERHDRLARDAPVPAPALAPETRAEVRAAVASLSPKLREALLVIEVLGLSYREAGQVLGVPVGTVKSRVFQARERLAAWRAEGGRAIGVATTVAQVEPLLAGFDPAGGLRELYPADQAQLWLDTRALVPLALRVTAARIPERARWAAAHGYRDEPGTVLLDLALRHVVLNRPLPTDAFPAPPTG